MNTQPQKSYSEVSELLLEIEREHNLNSMLWGGVYFWPLIRSRVHSNLLQKLGITDQPHHTVPTGKLKKVVAALKYMSRAVFNTLLPIPEVEVLIVDHPRKVNKRGRATDIYTEWLRFELDDMDVDYLVLDVPTNWSEHAIRRSSQLRYIENCGFIKKLLFNKSRILDEIPSEIKVVRDELISTFGADGDLLGAAVIQINNFRTDLNYFNRLIEKSKPKQIFYVVKNNNHALIESARINGIPITEIQHGIIHRWHMMYSYPNAVDVPYYPDRLCVFGPFWKSSAPMPLNENDFDYYPAPIIRVSELDTPNRRADSIIFISQPTIGRALSKYLAKLWTMSEANNYTWTVKLHPSEYLNWRNRYPELSSLQKSQKIEVIDSSNVELPVLLEGHEIAIGVQSTAVLEAMYYGCRTYILPLESSDALLALFDDPSQLVIEKPTDFFRRIKQRSFAKSIKTEELFSDQTRVHGLQVLRENQRKPNNEYGID